VHPLIVRLQRVRSSRIVVGMYETRHHPTPSPRLCAQWQLTDDRRLALTWSAQPRIVADEQDHELAVAA
jgi:hypothetical protein